jgi:hypothetical protein
MSEVLLHDIAGKIAREQFLLQWPIYALMVLIALVVGFSAAYVGAYAKKRGEALATKADFDELLSQLKTTTAVAEEVKTRVSHADWATRELKTLRRLKLEELLKAIYELVAWQDIEKDARIYNSGKDPGPSPLPKVELLVGLYFPELRPVVHECCQIHRQMVIETLQGNAKLLTAGDNAAARQQARQQFSNVWAPLYQKQLHAVSALEKACREIMEGLVGA